MDYAVAPSSKNSYGVLMVELPDCGVNDKVAITRLLHSALSKEGFFLDQSVFGSSFS